MFKEMNIFIYDTKSIESQRILKEYVGIYQYSLTEYLTPERDMLYSVTKIPRFRHLSE